MEINKKIPKSRFTNSFFKLNNVSPSSFRQWYLKSGMAFRDTEFWWENGKQRKKPHEGIDLRYYTNNSGNFVKLNQTNKFSVLFPGQVVQIFNDFNGKTLHLVHNIYEENTRLHSFYGHTNLLKIASPGDHMNENSAIISIANSVNNKVPSHLHLTVFWAPKYITESSINWDCINLVKEIKLIDPMLILG